MDRNIIFRSYMVILIVIGPLVLGLSLTLDGLVEPLGRIMLRIGLAGPWGSSGASFCLFLAAFVGLRLISLPLYVPIVRQGPMTITAYRLRRKGERKLLLLWLLMVLLDGIVLCLVAQTMERTAPIWLEQHPSLIGADYGRFGSIVFCAVTLTVTFALNTWVELEHRDDDTDPAEFLNALMVQLPLYLAIAITLVLARGKSPFIPIIVLAFSITKFACSLVFVVIAGCVGFFEQAFPQS